MGNSHFFFCEIGAAWVPEKMLVLKKKAGTSGESAGLYLLKKVRQSRCFWCGRKQILADVSMLLPGSEVFLSGKIAGRKLSFFHF